MSATYGSVEQQLPRRPPAISVSTCEGIESYRDACSEGTSLTAVAEKRTSDTGSEDLKLTALALFLLLAAATLLTASPGGLPASRLAHEQAKLARKRQGAAASLVQASLQPATESIDVARSQLELSLLSYCDTADLKAGGFRGYVVEAPSNKDFRTIVSTDQEKKVITVACKGTSTARDWVTNLQVELSTTPFDPCAQASTAEGKAARVHQGFADAYMSAQDATRDAVAQARKQHPDYEVWVTGHSLGGALASIAALDLVAAGVPVTRLYTFGQPRVGDAGFAACMEEFVPGARRFTKGADPVPRFPRREWQYMHFQREVFESADGALFDCEGREDPRCTERYPLWVSLLSFADHERYLGIATAIPPCSRAGSLQ